VAIDLAPFRGLLRGEGEPTPFQDTQFPYPIIQSLFGTDRPQDFLERARQLQEGPLEEQLSVALGLAELSEAARPDKGQSFINDRALRGRLVGLNTATGWALLWGRDEELCRLLQEASFQVFAVLEEGESLPGTYKLLGTRPTAAVYFIQAVLRYPHIYGRVPLAQPHTVKDFIEDYSPGVMFLAKKGLSGIEEALFLGGLSVGIPAVVPPDFASPYGNTAPAATPQEAVERALSLPSMKVRHRLKLHTALPFPVDPSFTSEEIKEGPTLGGTPSSSFVLTNEDRGEGIEVDGEMGPDLAVEISAGDPRVDLPMTHYLEEFASQMPAYISGVSVQAGDGSPLIRYRPGMALEPEHLAQVYHQGLRAHFRIDNLKVRLVFRPEKLAAMRQAAADFHQRRQQAIAAATEADTDHFWGCHRCHSFALEHTCTITPERPPQCGVRTWMHIKARAHLSDYDSRGWGPQREVASIHELIDKGRLLDPVRGEYEGVNRYTARRTGGLTSRVFLHSLLENPHSCCSCYQGIAFHMPEVDGIGIVDHAFKGRTPDGRTWDHISNLAAGKQTPGMAGISYDYLASPAFLKGDGGWERVVWMPHHLKERYAADKPWVATEADVDSLEALSAFLKTKRGV
jgi:acetyl-CoA decarbonylase/synthase complex subunit beta